MATFGERVASAASPLSVNRLGGELGAELGLFLFTAGESSRCAPGRVRSCSRVVAAKAMGMWTTGAVWNVVRRARQAMLALGMAPQAVSTAKTGQLLGRGSECSVMRSSAARRASEASATSAADLA